MDIESKGAYDRPLELGIQLPIVVIVLSLMFARGRVAFRS